MLRANSAKVHWDEHKKRWTVEIQIGAEVIKRPVPDHHEKSAAAEELKTQAVAIGRDEGYELDPAKVVVESS